MRRSGGRGCWPWIGAAVLVACTADTGSSGRHGLLGHNRAPNAVLPAVRVRLGDALSALRARSTLPIPDAWPTTGTHLDVTVPAQLVYGPEGRALTFPPGRFLSLVPMAGHVVEVRASPHLRALTVDEALALVGRLEAAAGTIGWRRVQRPATPDSVRRVVGALPSSALYQQVLSNWRLGDDEMFVSVQRTNSAEDLRLANAARGPHAIEQDQFLVDVYITNGPVFDRYAAIDRVRQ